MSAATRVCAIDGPAGAGKSTVARRVARELGWQLLDTGAIYRAVAFVARERGVAWDDEAALAALAARMDVSFRLEGDKNHVLVAVDGGEARDLSSEVRLPEISGGASAVSKLPAVRAALLDLQRRLGEHSAVVVEGRDIGTVVFPSAKAKFFLTASPEERARRRHRELLGAGQAAEFAAVLADQIARDKQDSERAAAPLKQADDAELVDSSGLSADEVVAKIVARVQAKLAIDRALPPV